MHTKYVLLKPLVHHARSSGSGSSSSNSNKGNGNDKEKRSKFIANQKKYDNLNQTTLDQRKLVAIDFELVFGGGGGGVVKCTTKNTMK